MLNAIEMDAVRKLLDHTSGAAPLAELDLCIVTEDLETAYRAGVGHRAAQAKAALARPPESRGGGAGKAPALPLMVSMGSLWEAEVMGVKAAHELVNKTLKDIDPYAKVPSVGTMQVSLSRGRAWSRKVDTDMGEQALTVLRMDKGAPTVAMVNIYPPKKLASTSVAKDSPQHKEAVKRGWRVTPAKPAQA